MAANEKNISGGLTRIKFPNLDEGEFGKSLAEQFKNIDLNFQKLGNLNLGKGDDGAGCTYINYNLNSIFFYWTGYSDNSKVHTELNSENKDVRALVERQNFRGFNKFIMSNENPLRARMEQLKKEVDADIQEFKDLTGGTEEDYVRMCAFLLFGQPMVFDHYKKTPETCSLFGALMTEYGKSAQASVGGTIYSSMWLLDWWNAEYKTDITDMKPAEYHAGDDRVDLFLTHMQLFDPGRITVAVAPALDNDKYAVGNYHPVGSLAYVYLDPRFRNHATGDEVDDASQWAGQSEISCVLYWSPRPLGHMHITSNDGSWDDHTCTGGFKVVNLFPQMYFDGTGFYWKINGTETKIPVTGRPGTDGKNSQFVVVERIGNIKDAVYNSCCYDKESKLWGPWPLKQTTYYEEWLGKEKLIRTAHSGRASRNENNSAYESAQKWVTDHINAHFDITKEKPAENTERFETTHGVASVDIKALEGWLPDATGFNSTEILHLYRIWGIVGRERFWRVKEGATQRTDAEYIPFRLSDPSYSKYNFGKDDEVELITNGATQNQMKALDGAPCIVVADPAYIYDRTNTTVWFSTLKAVKVFANKDDNNIMLVAYCGDENQMTTEIDDHGMAGIMQHLDPYTYKSTGSNRNKPRGLMLPIGSAEITDSQIASDIYGSHIIHSDLGGFVKRGTNAVVVDDERRTVNEYYGVPRPYADALSDINGDTMRSNNKLSTHATDMLKDPQFGEIKYKRFMHIGSVDDFRTLDYIPGPDEFSPAVPGRRTDHTFLKEGLFGRKSSVPYGTAGFFGNDRGDWFVGSELHIDEPVTITRYRDLRRKGILLRIEGDTIIGPHKHINFPDEYLHNRRDGGLFVQSTLTDELLEDQEGIWDHSVFHNVFGKGILPKFRAYTRNIQGTNDQKEDWNTTLCRTKTTETKKFKNGWLGSWLAQDAKGQDIYDDVSNKNGLEPNKEARASILADDMIGARMMLALDGLAIIDQTYIDDEGGLSIDATPFSVDHKGNIQTLGSEVRSNAQDTFWAFHTRWMREGLVFDAEPKYQIKDVLLPAYPTGFRHTTVPTTNKLMFGTNHQLYKILFNPKNGGSLQEGFNHWRYANMAEYLSYKDDDGRILTTRIPSQLSAGYVTNIGYAETKNNVEVFGTAFNTDTGLRIIPNGDLMPFITRMWCDLLYQEGALAVKGVHYMPVTTSFLSENYSGRYGVNIAYGLVIGGEGAAIGDPTVTTLNQLKARYNAHENGKYTQLDSDDTLGTYNTIDGSKLKWRSGDVNMFASATDMAEAPIGIWSRPGILTEESLIAQKDLWIGRVASVRGQARAMSFRRHTNAKNYYSLDWAFLLDDGKSSTRAPRHQDTHGSVWRGQKLDEPTPLIIDIGKGYEDQRLIKFGTVDTVYLDENNEIVIPSATNKDLITDRKVALFGKWPERGVQFEYAYGRALTNEAKNKSPRSGFRYNRIFDLCETGACNRFVVEQAVDDKWVNVKLYVAADAWYDWGGGARSLGIAAPGNGNHNSTFVQVATYAELPNPEYAPLNDIDSYWGAMYTDCKYIWDNGKGHKEQCGKGYQEKGTKIKGADRAHPGIVMRLTKDGKFVIQQCGLAGMLFPPNRAMRDVVNAGPMCVFEYSYPNSKYLYNLPEIYYIYYLVVNPTLNDAKDSLINFAWPVKKKLTGGTMLKDVSGPTITTTENELTGETTYYYDGIKLGDNEAIIVGTSKSAKVNPKFNTADVTWSLLAVGKNLQPVDSSPKYGFIKLKSNIPDNWEISDDEITYTGDDDTNKYPASSIAAGPAQMYNDYDSVIGDDDTTKHWLEIAENKEPNFVKSLTSDAPYLAVVIQSGSGDDTYYEYKLIKEFGKGSGDGVISQKTNVSFLGANQGTEFFNDASSKKILDGTFIPAGAFSGLAPNEKGYITTVAGNKASTLKVNAFSVRYWSAGGMCYLRLRVLLDKMDSMKKDSDNWGLAGLNDDYCTLSQDTNAWLPLSARMPNYPVILHYGGGSHWWRSSADRDYVGALDVRLDTDGRIRIANAFHARDLIKREGAHSSYPYCPVMDLLFVYQPDPDPTKVMTVQHYSETESNDSGDDQTDDNVTGGNGGSGESGSDTDSILIWDKLTAQGTTAEPTSELLSSWLGDTKRASLLEDIKSVEDNIIQNTYAYGSATIEKIAGDIRVSLLTSSYNHGTSDWSHRSINFTCDSNGGNIRLLGSYIIDKILSAGYYYANDEHGLNSSWIGTEIGSAVPTESKPYILQYANGSWTVVNKYVAPAADRIYFLAQTVASTIQSGVTPTVPAGFILGVKQNGTIYAPVGKSNYCETSFGTPTFPTQQQGVLKKILSQCKPGVIPPVTNGYNYLMSIKASDLNNIQNVTRETKMSPNGAADTSSIYAVGTAISSLRETNQCRWVKADGITMTPGYGPNNISFANVGSWYDISAPRLFLGLAMKYMVLGRHSDWPSQETADQLWGTIYSENTGFVPGWHQMIISFNDFILGSMTQECATLEPTTETGTNSKIVVSFGGMLSLQINYLQINGYVTAKCGGFDWPDAPAGYKYLANRYGIDAYGVNKLHRIPFMDDIWGSLKITECRTGQTVIVTYKGNTEAPTVKNL